MASGILEARFWAKVDRRSPNECWPWTGAKDGRGYGLLSVGGKMKGAHRVSFALHNEDYDIFAKPDRTKRSYVLHSCDQPECVNPAHLRLGSAYDNASDMMERGRHNWQPPRNRWDHTSLTPEIVRDVREHGQTWDGVCEMMKKHRLSQTAVQKIAAGKAYKWFEPENLPVRK